MNFAVPGDVITFFNPGGGGYGDPLERDPVMVRSDVINGYVSYEKAREAYGVVIDPETGEVDAQATEKLRVVRQQEP
jgi:N-methylhydantoinase B